MYRLEIYRVFLMIFCHFLEKSLPKSKLVSFETSDAAAFFSFQYVSAFFSSDDFPFYVSIYFQYSSTIIQFCITIQNLLIAQICPVIIVCILELTVRLFLVTTFPGSIRGNLVVHASIKRSG